MSIHKLKSAALAGLILAAATDTAMAYTGEDMAKDAKITMNEARGIALAAYSGKIIDAELEKEKGGSGLRYSFDIKKDAATHEVGVDANTGRLLENAPEGKNPN